MSQSHFEGPLRSRWGRPAGCDLVYSCVNFYQGEKSQDIWARKKGSVPSRYLGIMVSLPGKGLREEILLNQRKMLKPSCCVLWGQVISIVYPQLRDPGHSPGTQPGPRHWASSLPGTLCQAERSCHPCQPNCWSCCESDSSERLAVAPLEFSVR